MAKSTKPSWLTIKGTQRWTAAQASWVIGELERSGLGVARFAARHDLDPQRLYFWRKRVKRSVPSSAALVEVELPKHAVSAQRAQGTEIEIELVSGRRLRVSDRIEGNALRRVVSALED